MQVNNEIIDAIKKGAVGVMPTDTIFGIVASVDKPESLNRIYEAKGRDFNKKLIHLIGDIGQLSELGVTLTDNQKITLNELWPDTVSVELACDDKKPYLHKGTYCVAVRMPKEFWLREVVKQTGPIVATSANLSGQPTPTSIDQIKTQLPGLDFYLDGPTGSIPSKLARVQLNGEIEWLSRG